MASTTIYKSSFFSLPASVRHTICSHLLSPHPEDDATTINYTLHWPWFENPSNSTFNGTTQIDLCRCPQRVRQSNSPTEDHIYTRYKCYGPDVRFKSATQDLWVVGTEYARSGQINFPRPATRRELDRRPAANILSTCKTVYAEAVPILYRGRNFVFLTGPCPRGRYQAFATQMFLMRLGMLARANVTALSLVVQSCEEDCDVKDVERAYANLAACVQRTLPAFRTLCLNVWDERLKSAAFVFAALFDSTGVKRIGVATDPQYGRVVHCGNVESFATALHIGKEEISYPSKHGATIRARKTAKHTKAERAEPVWEEVQDEELAADQVDDGISMQDAPIVHTKTRDKNLSKGRRGLSKRNKGTAKRIEPLRGDDEDDEWVDAGTRHSIEETTAGRIDSWELV